MAVHGMVQCRRTRDGCAAEWAWKLRSVITLAEQRAGRCSVGRLLQASLYTCQVCWSDEGCPMSYHLLSSAHCHPGRALCYPTLAGQIAELCGTQLACAYQACI